MGQNEHERRQLTTRHAGIIADLFPILLPSDIAQQFMRDQHWLGIGFLHLKFHSSSPPFYCVKSLMTPLRHESDQLVGFLDRVEWPKIPMDTLTLHSGLRALAQLQQRRNQLGQIKDVPAKMQAIAVDLLHEP